MTLYWIDLVFVESTDIRDKERYYKIRYLLFTNITYSDKVLSKMALNFSSLKLIKLLMCISLCSYITSTSKKRHFL